MTTSDAPRPEQAAPATRRRRPRRRLLIRRFGRNTEGAAAVEFAFVGVLFFAFVFAIFEISLIFFGSQMLETATQDSARLILTGQQQKSDAVPNPNGTAQTPAQKLTAFRKTLCDPAPGNGERSMLSYLFDCTKLIVDVRSYSSCFNGADMSLPIVNGKIASGFTPQYDPGDATDVVVVRVLYPWDTWVVDWPYRMLSIVMDFSNMDGRKRMLMASAAFRNEPFSRDRQVSTASCS